MPRPDNRLPNQLRELSFTRGYTRMAPGSVLVKMGRTTVLCTCCIEPKVPDFLVGRGKGWLTAEYGMLPGSTNTRKPRDKAGKVDGRSVEIQRLIGRSLRAVVNLDKLGERTLWIDCDVLEADGGTRTASVTGGFIALALAMAKLGAAGKLRAPVIRDQVAAVSVGHVGGQLLLDLDYKEDSSARVDLNVVATEGGGIVEIQGTAEGAAVPRSDIDKMTDLALEGIAQLCEVQRQALSLAGVELDQLLIPRT
jgi:ribonuclease PH